MRIALSSSLIALATGVFVLAGCAGSSTSRMGAGIAPAQCHAAGAEAVLGQPIEAQLVEQALAGSGALRSRVIRPGQAVTLDLDPLRLNIELDADGRIHRLRCG
jgi:hypothetical protein